MRPGTGPSGSITGKIVNRVQNTCLSSAVFADQEVQFRQGEVTGLDGFVIFYDDAADGHKFLLGMAGWIIAVSVPLTIVLFKEIVS